MIRIRLQRHGSKKAPFYRLVATDKRNKRDGRFNELLGTYNPRVEPNIIDFNMDRVEWWISQGASASESVEMLIKKSRDGRGTTVAAYVEANKARREEARQKALLARTVDQVASQAPAPASAE
jgi:small subunit ribosomal protein S16